MTHLTLPSRKVAKWTTRLWPDPGPGNVKGQSPDRGHAEARRQCCRRQPRGPRFLSGHQVHQWTYGLRRGTRPPRWYGN
jgi:hypothetical protein